MKKYLLALFMIILASTLVFTSCGEPAATTTTPAQTTATTTPLQTQTTQPTTTTQTTPRGGTLRFLHNPAPPVSPGNPTKMSSAWDYMMSSPAVETLFRAEADGTIIPHLVDSWEVGEDLKSYTFTLKKGIKFHDGADFDAEAVKFNLDRYIESGKSELKAVTSTEILDNYTIRLNLSEFDSTIPSSLSINACAYIISPTAVETFGEDLVGVNPIGTGPFKFVSWQRDVSIIYEKFDDYWQEGKPYLDRIEFIFIPDPMVAVASFRAGDGDILFTQQVKEGSELKATGEFNVVPQMSVISTLGISVYPENTPLANLKVRQAMAYAIDIEAINRNLGYGLIEPAWQLSVPGNFAYNPDIGGYHYNPEKARQLLDEAGYDGSIIKLQPMISGPLVPMWEAVQGYLGAVGIKTELEPWAAGKFFQAIAEGWEGLTHFSIGVAYPDPINTFLQRFQDDPMYKSILHVPAIEQKLRQATSEPDTGKKQALIWEAHKMIVDDYCLIIPIWAQPNLIISYPRVHDTKIGEPWTNTWTPENAWLSK